MSRVTIEHDVAGSRYVLRLEGRAIGLADYVRSGDAVAITHTAVEPAQTGQGFGSALVAAALEDLRASGTKVVPRCPFVAAFIDDHPEYAELLASREPQR
jgi:predicted GNAT family acetyltransferase